MLAQYITLLNDNSFRIGGNVHLDVSATNNEAVSDNIDQFIDRIILILKYLNGFDVVYKTIITIL